MDLVSEEEEEIEKYLMDIKKEIEKIPKGQSERITDTNIENVNLEKIDNKDLATLKSLMEPEIYSQLTIDNLNLEQHSLGEFKQRFYLQTSKPDKGKDSPRSFVFISANLVDTIYRLAQKPEVADSTKREIIFSKIVESNMRDILDDLEKYNIMQVYFIPISGFLRIMHQSEWNAYKYYEKRLRGIANFADRKYFRETIKEETHFRRSNPYIDTGGLGFVVTYSIIIENKNLNVMGMIGVDRRLDIKKCLEETGVGFPYLGKDFLFDYYEIADKEKYKGFKDEQLRNAIEQLFTKKDEPFSKKIGKSEDDSSAFAFIVNEEEIAYFVFDPIKIKKKYYFLLILYIVLIALLFSLIVFSLVSNLFAARMEKIHTEVVNHLNGGLVILGEDWKIKFHNRKFADLIHDKNPKGKNFLSAYLNDTSQAEYREKVEKSEKGFEFAGRIRRSDGTILPAIVTSSVIAYPGVERARMLIIIPAEQLEQTIGARFIHSFSHTLKIPVSGILLLADLMRRKRKRAKFDHYFSLMKQQVEEFRLMVTNLMGMSRLELQESHPKKAPTNIASILRSLFKSFREKADKKNLELNNYIPEKLNAQVDPGMMHVVFNNLLENALKYTNQGQITVQAHDDLTTITVSIRDSGMGIPEDETQRVFEKFYRGRAPEVQAMEGVGIGLYLSQRYVELHDGTIDYEPVMEEKKDKIGRIIKKITGSIFIVKIPRK
ncbi:sensor histidine kinase [Acidobacteriota bacterium]